jgi:hypothetical protein
MKVEVIERYRVVERVRQHFWEIRSDGKLIEVTLFDPTKALDDMCKELQDKENINIDIQDVSLSET